ncbi:MAG: substrate-binding domain-containing protein [Phycisphaeraceae bacterium]
MARSPTRIVVVGDESAYLAGIRRGIMRYARAAGPWAVHNAYNPNTPAAVRGWRPAGAIVNWHGGAWSQLVEALPGPIVTVSAARLPGAPAVRPDNHAAGRLQAEHLIDCGCRELVYMKAAGMAAALRTAGFVEAAAEQGLTVRVETPFEAGWPADWEKMDHMTGQWLAGMPLPTGVACHDDGRARIVAEAALNAGIPIPEHIALIGCNDEPDACEMCYPPLSSVDLNLEKVGYEAARHLSLQIQGQPLPVDDLLIEPVGVSTRGSTDTIALSDPTMIRAIRFIRDHVDRPTSVEHVLDHMNISRRALEKKFREHLGHTPLKEIQRTHLRKARELLRLTDLPMPAIARAAGYTSAAAMSVMFRKHAGEPPTSYRARHRLQ